jgi:hypothetical protein
MKTIIRIAKQVGNERRGIYTCSDVSGEFREFRAENLYSDNRHPNPQDDSLLFSSAKHLFHMEWPVRWKGGEYVFGFRDYAQMRSWIYQDAILDALHNEGFKVYTLAGDVIYGNAQAVIHDATSQVLKEQSILDFWAENEEKNLRA